MSRVEGNKFIVEEEAPNKCEYCGETAELRPYGKNGENICFKCGMKNRAETEKQFKKRVENCDVIISRDSQLN